MGNFEMVYRLCFGIFFKCQFKNKIHKKEIKNGNYFMYYLAALQNF
jgi:hypothetical protein